MTHSFLSAASAAIRGLPLAAFKAALLLRCPAICVVLLLLMLLCAVAIAMEIDNQLAAVPTRHAGYDHAVA